MRYDIVFDSESRLMANTGIDHSDDGNHDTIILHFTVNDSGGLLSGFTGYCVLDSKERIEIENDEVELAIEDIKCDRLRFQLCYAKEGQRFYSLNTAFLNIDKAIV